MEYKHRFGYESQAINAGVPVSGGYGDTSVITDNGAIDWVEQQWDEYGDQILDGVQTALTVASMFAPPGVGVVIGLANLGISYARGEEISALDVGMALLPGVGAAGKLFNVGGKILGKSADAVEAAHRVATSGSMVLMGLGEAYYAKESLRDSYEAFKKGDYLGAALSLGEAGMSIVGAKQGLKSVKGLTIGRYSHCQQQRVYDWHSNQDSCFVAGTPVECEHGSTAIEQIVAGERVWSRDENDPNASLTLQVVEETFIRQALVWKLTIDGQTIRTTAEHPFWRELDGWVAINLLKAGDRLLCKDNSYVVLQQIVDTGEYQTVYNMRVAESRTYFIGNGHWGFGVWVHNAPYSLPSGHRVGRHSELNKARVKDSHHIIQNAAVRDIPGYSRSRAPTIELTGPSTLEGSPHYQATRAQDLPGGGTYAAERRIAYRSLRSAGLDPSDARLAIDRADNYFLGELGITMSTVTRPPGNRR